MKRRCNPIDEALKLNTVEVVEQLYFLPSDAVLYKYTNRTDRYAIALYSELSNTYIMVFKGTRQECNKAYTGFLDGKDTFYIPRLR